MNVTLHLNPEVEAGLVAQAQANGMTLETYLLTLVEGSRSQTPMERIVDRAEAVSRMLEFGDRHQLSLGEPITRKMLSEDHRF